MSPFAKLVRGRIAELEFARQAIERKYSETAVSKVERAALIGENELALKYWKKKAALIGSSPETAA